MSLDAPKSDAELLAIYERQQARAPIAIVRNGVALGPDSPLRPRREDPKTAYRRRKATKTEQDIQVALFEWVDDEQTLRRYPELGLYHAIPNGGHRSPAVAAKLKAEGVRPGVLDTHLPVARGGYHSLYIEIKKPGATLTPEQPHWIAGLAREGNKVVIHTTWEGARDELLDYLSLPTENG